METITIEYKCGGIGCIGHHVAITGDENDAKASVKAIVKELIFQANKVPDDLVISINGENQTLDVLMAMLFNAFEEM